MEILLEDRTRTPKSASSVSWNPELKLLRILQATDEEDEEIHPSGAQSEVSEVQAEGCSGSHSDLGTWGQEGEGTSTPWSPYQGLTLGILFSSLASTCFWNKWEKKPVLTWTVSLPLGPRVILVIKQSRCLSIDSFLCFWVTFISLLKCWKVSSYRKMNLACANP